MNSKKLWHSFAVILTYLCLVAGIATLGSIFFQNVQSNWVVALIVGVGFWLILCALHEKHVAFTILAFITNAVGAGFSIAAFVIGKSLSLSVFALPMLAVMVAFLYLLLMALLTVTPLKNFIWYVIVSSLVWITASVLVGVFLFPTFFGIFQIPLPNEFGLLLTFFFLLLGFLAMGTLFQAEDFFELLFHMIGPALIATFFIIVIVLLCLAGCDSCDCDGGCDGGCDCGSGQGGKYNPTTYGKKRSSTTMSSYSNP